MRTQRLWHSTEARKLTEAPHGTAAPDLSHCTSLVISRPSFLQSCPVTNRLQTLILWAGNPAGGGGLVSGKAWKYQTNHPKRERDDRSVSRREGESNTPVTGNPPGARKKKGKMKGGVTDV